MAKKKSKGTVKEKEEKAPENEPLEEPDSKSSKVATNAGNGGSKLEWEEIDEIKTKKKSKKGATDKKKAAGKEPAKNGKDSSEEADSNEGLEQLSLPEIDQIVQEESVSGEIEQSTGKPEKPKESKGEDGSRDEDTVEIIDEDAMESPDLVESMRAQDKKPREAWKILFSGLDFAGKSSILATIKHEFQKLVNPQPTKLTERSSFSFLGQDVAEWDLGGQRLYRIQYLKRPIKYYADTSILFYVIDVLDEERYEEAIDFLYDTLQLFDKLNINPLISILFHKMDPEVVKDAKKSRIELKITQLTNKIKVLTYGRDVMFFRTSIFNRFSVIDAFSRSMLELFPDKNVVDYALAELAQKTAANIIILLDENRFILGQNIISSSDRQYDELVKLSQDTLLSFLYLHENFKLYPFLDSNYMIIQLERFSFLWVEIQENNHPFYLIVFKDGADFQSLLEMDVKSLGKILVKLIKR